MHIIQQGWMFRSLFQIKQFCGQLSRNVLAWILVQTITQKLEGRTTAFEVPGEAETADTGFNLIRVRSLMGGLQRKSLKKHAL